MVIRQILNSQNDSNMDNEIFKATIISCMFSKFTFVFSVLVIPTNQLIEILNQSKNFKIPSSAKYMAYFYDVNARNLNIPKKNTKIKQNV